MYTTFHANGDIYPCLVAPMGLAGMPGTWTRLINALFGCSDFAAFVVVYLDDICVFSRSLEEHAEHLRRVFDENTLARTRSNDAEQNTSKPKQLNGNERVEQMTSAGVDYVTDRRNELARLGVSTQLQEMTQILSILSDIKHQLGEIDTAIVSAQGQAAQRLEEDRDVLLAER